MFESMEPVVLSVHSLQLPDASAGVPFLTEGRLWTQMAESEFPVGEDWEGCDAIRVSALADVREITATQNGSRCFLIVVKDCVIDV